MKRNYQTEMEEEIARLSGRRPTLLLHSCCGPCSTSVLERLLPDWRITLFFCNPNLTEPEEYQTRLAEQKRFLAEWDRAGEIAFAEGPYEPQRYLAAVRGLEGEPEGGKRCAVCFRIRLEAAARAARERGIGHFTTTLSVSPHKDHKLLCEIGEALAQEYGLVYVTEDFKKTDGCRRAVELSKQYHLYRQDYGGCVFGRRPAQQAPGQK